MVSLLFSEKYRKFFLENSLLTHMLFRSVWSPCIRIFQLLISSLIPLWSKSRHSMVLNLLRCFMGHNLVGLSWWLFNVSLRRMCFLSLSNKAVDRCPLYSVDWCCLVQKLYPYWFLACRICPSLIGNVESC